MKTSNPTFPGTLLMDGMGRLPSEPLRDLIDIMIEPGKPFPSAPPEGLSPAVIREAISRVTDQLPANYTEFNGYLIQDGMGILPGELRDLVDIMLEPGASFTPLEGLSPAVIREAISRVTDQLPAYPEFPEHLFFSGPTGSGMTTGIVRPIVRDALLRKSSSQANFGRRLVNDNPGAGVRPLSSAILSSLEQMASEPVERLVELKQPSTPTLILCVAGIAVCALLSYAAFTGAF